MKYQEALSYIEEITGLGIVPGLDSIKELCRELGNPQENLKFVHIAGTNGKGSALAFISTILQVAGYRVGRYVSPTIFEYRERIQVDGKMISKVALGELMEQVKAACERMVTRGLSQPTPFEVETALAFLYFQKKKCDIVVLETGMGGLYDATNLITTTQVAVITSVGMDHMQFLGNTVEKIAGQKAGIIKNGCYVICMMQDEAVMQVVDQAANEKQAKLVVADAGHALRVRYGVEKQQFDYDGMKNLIITLAGKHQITNAVVAIEAIRALGQKGFPVSEQAIREGLLATRWPGRFTVVSKKPLFVVDGAHNEDAAQKLADSIEFYFTNRRIIYIMGILKDKEYDKVISLTHKYADQIITVTPPNNPRAMHAYDLAKEIAKVHTAVTAVDSLEEAVEMSRLLAGKDDVIIAFGSLSYLGRLMDILGYER
ncbi:MAG: bifunctional folylpolyglutamate synthase/dihydrofolate synthase [Lachnospiraceae bacterium]|nr:bifunctional folylpolyglutamate synthase/dihydrofolate synthase [Lachnospiraceae bacterium]